MIFHGHSMPKHRPVETQPFGHVQVSLGPGKRGCLGERPEGVPGLPAIYLYLAKFSLGVL